MKTFTLAWFFSAVLCIHGNAHAHDIVPDPAITATPTAADILTRVSQVYDEIRTYRDEGEVDSIIRGTTSQLHFTTAYVRPSAFRFEYSSAGSVFKRGDEYVVWMNGQNIKTWWSIQADVRSARRIDQAIAGATGVSGGTAYTIPALLIKEAAWKGRTWASTDGAYRIADGIEQGIDCFRIQRTRTVPGVEPNRSVKVKETYWVAKSSALLLKIDEESDFGTFLASSVTRYRPVINESIPGSALEFGH